MKKSFMNNIINFVDSNVRQRIDRVANNNNDFFGDDLLLVERQFEDLKNVFIESEKRISTMLQSLASSSTSTLVGTYTHNVHTSLSNLTTISPQLGNSSGQNVINEAQQAKSKQSNSILYQNDYITKSNIDNHPQKSNNSFESYSYVDDIKKHKKLPIVSFLKFLIKSNNKLKSDSILATTFSQCSKLQTQLTKLYLSYEQKVESQCLKPIQQVTEVDVPNIVKLRKIFIKSHNDLESVRSKYNGANQKQQQSQQTSQQVGHVSAQTSAQQAHLNKIDQLKTELDETLTRFEQARDTYATELYAFVCKETDLVKLFKKFYQYQTEYHQQVALTIQGSLPLLDNILVTTPRKSVFGLSLNEHLSHTGRARSLVIDLCVHLLYANALNEEGLFRIPGSSIKIKNLKNAINAWFVTLASQNELAYDLQSVGGGCSASVLAIYNLFKHVASRKPLSAVAFVGGDNIGHCTTTSIGRDELGDVTTSTICNNQQIMFDVHTIAGLLKLYLRELPEPLFTHALYNQLIEVTLKTVKNEPTDTSLGQMISKLPKTNHENLRHLIRFLHLLTCHCERNKMTATNLAITMAPSLIWARPQTVLGEQADVDDNENKLDDMQMLNMQMNSVGISASLHAMVIENLINNAETLFPGQVQFSLPELIIYEQSLSINSSSGTHKHDRNQKSTSPTGLSTASSSSFSSTSSKGKHSRIGGSMEGLINENSNIILSKKPQFRAGTSRPMSVNLSGNRRENQSLNDHKPPPVPPAPAPTSRSHLRNTCDQLTNRTFSSHQKPPAPPPPPSSTTSLRRAKEQQLIKQQEDFNNEQVNPVTKVVAFQSRPKPSANNKTNSTRPNVPPPDRPTRSSPTTVDQPDLYQQEPLAEPMNKIEESDKLVTDDRSLLSPSDSDLRTDFEVNSADDDIDVSVSVSPPVSISSTSHIDGYNEESSFDNDCKSMENSWSNTEKENASKELESLDKLGDLGQNQHIRVNGEVDKVRTESKNDSSKPQPPMKPPRSVSPKMTQSTPL